MCALIWEQYYPKTESSPLEISVDIQKNIVWNHTCNMLGFVFSSQFVASDRFMIPDLRQKCEALLLRSLSITNAIKIFQLGYLYEQGGSKLKSASMDFISKNYLEIRKSQDWALLKQEPDGAEKIDEILAYVAANQ